MNPSRSRAWFRRVWLILLLIPFLAFDVVVTLHHFECLPWWSGTTLGSPSDPRSGIGLWVHHAPV